jgi:hypothetical protein
MRIRGVRIIELAELDAMGDLRLPCEGHPCGVVYYQPV